MKYIYKTLLLFVCIFCFSVYIKAITKPTSFIVKDQDGNFLKNVTFKLKNIDGSISFDIINNFDGTYYIDKFNSSINIDKIIGEKQNQLMKNDYNNLRVYPTNYFSNENVFINEINDNNGVWYDEKEKVIRILTFMYLEELEVNEGYAKEKFIVPVYILKSTENNNISLNPLNIYIENDETLDFSNLVSVLEYIKDNKEDMVSYTDCGELPKDYFDLFILKKTSSNSSSESETSCFGFPMIVSYKGSISLSIRTLVNDSNETNVLLNNKVGVKILVLNNGSIKSEDNIITTTIPKELKYIDNSASNGGVYDENTRKITWNNSINPGEQLKLTYKVQVPSDEEEEQLFRLNASVKNSEVGEITSNISSIKVKELTNPKTADNNKTYFLGIVLFISTLLFLIIKKKSIIKSI